MGRDSGRRARVIGPLKLAPKAAAGRRDGVALTVRFFGLVRAAFGRSGRGTRGAVRFDEGICQQRKVPGERAGGGIWITMFVVAGRKLGQWNLLA